MGTSKGKHGVMGWDGLMDGMDSMEGVMDWPMVKTTTTSMGSDDLMMKMLFTGGGMISFDILQKHAHPSLGPITHTTIRHTPPLRVPLFSHRVKLIVLPRVVFVKRHR